ncbi:MAG: hypothetical protein IKX00_00115 [Bacilli bacterium]|nr:hypothetical protein [Bacilli bacterium]
MKLDNRGWGLGFLIVIGALFLLILIFVSLRIRALTHQTKSDDKSDKNKTNENTTIDSSLYETLEQVLKRAGESYTINNSSLIDNIDDHITVDYEELKSSGYIESLADPSGNGNCDGYVFIKNDYSVQPFIKCSNYKTTNYDLWVD